MVSLRIRRRPPASPRSAPLGPRALAPVFTPVVAGRAALCLSALLGLCGCSGTPFGDQLARSFSAGPAAPPSAAVAGGGASSPQGPSSQRPAASPASSAGNPAANPAANAASTASTGPLRVGGGARQVAQPAARQAPPAPTAAAPYRVTIRLPAADPSAPAERVTEALRGAGVPFEVETIERMGASGAAEGPAAPLVPQRTPAPAPR
jgi:hypothetical protein